MTDAGTGLSNRRRATLHLERLRYASTVSVSRAADSICLSTMS